MKVFVICVTYNPDFELLKESIRSLYYQVSSFVIVDNTPSIEKRVNYSFLNKYEWTSKVHLITLGDNYGIAYAQNIGIKYALENNADFILTTDQDTVYPQKYVESLLSIFRKYENVYKIAAIAPFFRNTNLNYEVYKIVEKEKNDNIRLRKFASRDGLEDYYTVYYTISSGMLIHKNALKDIGFMNESFFIDWVDTEWCLRANHKGYNILQIPSVCIQHKLGNLVVRVFNKYIVSHNYIRRYYIFRNGIYILLYYKDLSFQVRLFLFRVLINILINHLIVSENKLAEVYNKYCAFIDAIKKRLGPLNRTLIAS